MVDPYAVLGVTPGSHLDDVRRAFKRAVKMNHPDLHPGDPAAAARLRDVVAAYERVVKRASSQSAAKGAGSRVVVHCRIRGADLFGSLPYDRHAQAQAIEVELRALDTCGICGGVGFEEVSASFWRAVRFECEVCKGGGLVRVERRVRIRLPREFRKLGSEGRIRLRHIGLPRPGLTRGDAILSIDVADHRASRERDQ